MTVKLRKLISGGQTGVDRAALDVAVKLHIPCGGWCPRGRWAEDGPISSLYPLQETPSEEPAQRTEWNIRDSQGTLILHAGEVTGGTHLTLELVRQYREPVLVLDLTRGPAPGQVRLWVANQEIHILNIAGPRESESPGIYASALAFLTDALSPCRET